MLGQHQGVLAGQQFLGWAAGASIPGDTPQEQLWYTLRAPSGPGAQAIRWRTGLPAHERLQSAQPILAEPGLLGWGVLSGVLT